ncbi:hypothetical protein PENNAL_c0136G10027 [Penicillium nalgiovense]|uniref:Uncharacterized protein n=1 Tax=Penicillium nalgiovense TaxID=60175 RepID=A0A1V6X2M5_PENNA|nr:hypothetical protein PENNAL_c0136G10027 [Penicillium nalgiovense]
MNGGVYSVTRLWLSEVARCTQRGLFEAIAGECDELDTTSCQHAMNGDALMNTIRTFCELYEQRPSYSRHSSRMRREQFCLLELPYTVPMRSQAICPFLMITGGKDEE